MTKHVTIRIHYHKDGKKKTTTTTVPKDKWQRMDKQRYCNGHCTVLRGRFIKYEELSNE